MQPNGDIWASSFKGFLLKYDNSARHWSVYKTYHKDPYVNMHNKEITAFDFSDSLHGWVLTYGRLIYTSDGGTSWFEVEKRAEKY